jgi:hypothetical protein
MGDEDRKDLNRREFLRKAAITGAVAWALPVVQSVAATPAYAFHQGTPHPCPHSDPDTSGGSCMGTCKAKCISQGCTGEGGRCAPKCQVGAGICSGANVCCENACNPNAWNCKVGSTCLAVATFAGC